MTEDNLVALKKRYQNILKIKESTQSLEQIKSELLKQKQFLETNSVVKQYLSIIDSINEVENSISKIDNDYGDDSKVLQKLIDSMYIEKTNGIYVYAGTYLNYGRDNIIHISNNYYHPHAVSVYIDIEKTYSEGKIVIPMKDFPQFELENIVLYPFKLTPFALHQQAQELFFKTCIESTQEEAIQKVLKLVNSKSI